jgi:hypothetical protein
LVMMKISASIFIWKFQRVKCDITSPYFQIPIYLQDGQLTYSTYTKSQLHQEAESCLHILFIKWIHIHVHWIPNTTPVISQ